MTTIETEKRGWEPMNDIRKPRRIGRSILAVLMGIVAGVAVTLATDFVLHAIHLFPPWDQRVPDGLLALATAYRTVYSVGASYLTARLAPYSPMKHALVGGLIGFIVSLAGAIATWNGGPQFQSHWYPVALTLLAIPCAWVGGMLHLRQTQTLTS
jgi:multisubunit Na+/H+ antiporter MnhB subunit